MALMRKSLIVGLLPSLGGAIALLSVFPAAALVGGAPKANQSIARYVVMVAGSDKTFCSGVVIARDLILTAAQCIHPATSYKIVGFDAPRTLKNVASTIVHPDWDPTAVLRHRVSADVALIKLAASSSLRASRLGRPTEDGHGWLSSHRRRIRLCNSRERQNGGHITCSTFAGDWKSRHASNPFG